MTTVFIKLFFNISGGEIFIILLIVFIVFGPSKIPEIARSLGRMMNEVKKASSDISREFRKETSGIERDFKKVSGEVSNNLKALTDDPLNNIDQTDNHGNEEVIPDVYLKNDTSEETTGNKDDEAGEKTGETIQ